MGAVKCFYMVLVLFSVTFSQDLPTSLQALKCNRDDKQYSSCLKFGVALEWDKLMQGVPEIGLPSLDPFVLDYHEINKKLGIIAKIEATFKDMVITGLTSAKSLQKLKADPKTYQGYFEVDAQHLHITTNYSASGNLMVMKLDSKGFAVLDLGVNIYAEIKLKVMKGSNYDYFQVDYIRPDFIAQHPILTLTPANGSNKNNAKFIEKFFNDNPERTINIIKPVVLKEAEKIAKQILNNSLSKVAINEWFSN